MGRPLHVYRVASDTTKVPHTLLLADDSVTIQRVIELTFADEDIKVVAVSDGDQAIEKLDAAPPDIVLADIGMPGKNGYEVAQYIRQSPKLSHIPVVLLTGAFEPVDQARASEAGCDGVLAKPFEPQMVIGRVKELLAKGRGAGGPLEGRSRLEDATNDLVRQTTHGNPYLAVVRGSVRRATVAGGPGIALELSGRSPVTGQEERVRVVSRAVVDREPHFLRIRRKVCHHGTEPLHARMQQREQQRRDEYEADERRVKCDRQSRDGERENHNPHRASILFTAPRSVSMTISAIALSARRARNCHAAKRTHVCVVARYAAAIVASDISTIEFTFFFRPTVKIGTCTAIVATTIASAIGIKYAKKQATVAVNQIDIV